MNYSDFPNYFQASDNISVQSQSNYLHFIRVDLVSMILASALAIYNYQLTEYKLFIYIISGLLLLLSLVLTIILKSKNFEDTWYQGRALAESCKTLTWRFIMCSEYFEKNILEIKVKERFIERIKEITNEFSSLTKELNSKTLNLPIVTKKMLELRAMDFSDRKSYYISKRIEDQKEWYSTKAEHNKGKYNLWFYIIIISQVLALISVVFLIKNPENNWNFVGLFTTVASSSISWLQLKQYQELKQAYTTASQELNFIVSLSEKVKTEDELSKFILDSENAISREHTLWVAQRRK
ncbi:Protein of unknown function [Lutibacter oricola]|uniref:SMODS and SLOG-associating 2TM effector domain-containing protein n=1 Tax=Lutibacter oricola TaxID=762486 RepID=A0A1H3E915_9FLAO|nr:DUF4231 domain-containing protein [Lutibacter oricola]SDX74758.1 Protein of unknown function [Lutibacter oricola]